MKNTVIDLGGIPGPNHCWKATESVYIAVTLGIRTSFAVQTVLECAVAPLAGPL